MMHQGCRVITSDGQDRGCQREPAHGAVLDASPGRVARDLGSGLGGMLGSEHRRGGLLCPGGSLLGLLLVPGHREGGTTLKCAQQSQQFLNFSQQFLNYAQCT